MLRCSKCKRRTHFLCTRLPAYQLFIFTKKEVKRENIQDVLANSAPTVGGGRNKQISKKRERNKGFLSFSLIKKYSRRFGPTYYRSYTKIFPTIQKAKSSNFSDLCAYQKLTAPFEWLEVGRNPRLTLYSMNNNLKETRWPDMQRIHVFFIYFQMKKMMGKKQRKFVCHICCGDVPLEFYDNSIEKGISTLLTSWRLRK